MRESRRVEARCAPLQERSERFLSAFSAGKNRDMLGCMSSMVLGLSLQSGRSSASA